MASQAEVDLVISTADALPELERDLAAIVRTAENGAPEIDVQAGLAVQQTIASLSTDLQRAITAAEASGSELEVEAVLNQINSLNQISGDLTTIIQIAQNNADNIDLQAEVDALGSLSDIQSELRSIVATAEATAPPIELEVDVDRAGRGRAALAGLARGLKGVLPSLGKFATTLPAVGLGAAATAQTVAGLAGAVAQLGPAAAVAVPALAAVQLASGAVKLAMVGVGDAITAAFDDSTKPEELAKALEKLSPAAKEFVLELRSMKKELTAVQQDVQENFFAGLDDSLVALKEDVLPGVAAALVQVSGELSSMASGAADAAAQLGRDGTLGRALEGAVNGIANLVDAPGLVVTALGQLAAAAAPAFERITAGAARAAESIAGRLAKAFESGALESAISGAVDSIAQLGRIAGNVFEGLGNIIGSLSSGGEGLFSVLEKITQAFADVTASDGFQRALSALSDTLSILAGALLPVISSALTALGPVFEALAGPIQILVQALGPVLSKIVAALGPVLVSLAGVLGQLAIALLPIINLAGELIVAILPVLIPLFDAVGQTINALVPFIETLAGILTAELVPIFTKLATEVLPQILPPLVELATSLIPVLTDALVQLAPSLVELAVTFSELLVALTPLIVEVLNLTLAFVEKLGPVIKPILGLVLDLINLGLKVLTEFISGVVVPAIGILVDLLQGDFSGAWRRVQELIGNVVEKIKGHIDDMAQQIGAKLRELATAAVNKGRELVDGFSRELGRIVGRAQDIMSQVPGAVRDGLGHAGTLLFSAGADIVQGLINGISGKLGRLREIAGEVAGAVTGPIKFLLDIRSPSTVMRKVGNDTMEGFRLGIADALPALRTELQGVAGQVPSFALPGGQTLQLPQLGQQKPNVQVFIGNEEFHGRIDSRIARADIARSRIMTQGVRR